jgi:hypothetical protein
MRNHNNRLSGSKAFYTIFWSGIISGILDSAAACTVFYLKQGLSPAEVMKFIATGVYGPEAFVGGTPMVILGIFLHFFIAFAIAGVYYFIFPVFRILNSKPVLSGFVFGGLVWIVMNLLIIPLTQVPPAPFEATAALVSVVWHMVLVGVPIAIITKKAFVN